MSGTALPLSENPTIAEDTPGASGTCTAIRSPPPESATDRRRRFLEAATNGRGDEVQALLSDKSIEITKSNLGDALQAAAGGGHAEIVSFLLKAGADVDYRLAPYYGRTALQAAAWGGHAQIVSTLLKVGARVDSPAAYDNGRTPLQAAAEGGSAETVSTLLEAGADVNAPPATHKGRTALQAAAERGHADIVSTLLKAGAEVDSPPSQQDGRTALQAAAECGHTDIVSTLLKAGADVDSPPAKFYGKTALQAAVGRGLTEMVSILLKAGAEVDSPPSYYGGKTALQTAAGRGLTEMVSIVLDAGAKVDSPPSYYRGRTALQAAAEGGHVGIVSTLLEAGADVNSPPAPDWGRTALQAAAGGGHADIVSILLKAGTDVDSPPARFNGRTALQAAADGGYVEVVSTLLKAGVKVEPTMIWAVEGGHLMVIQILLDAGVDIDVVDKQGHSYLTRGISHPAVVRKLLKRNAATHFRALDGATSLHFAVRGQHTESVSLLLDHGASIESADYDNQKPLDIAFNNSQPSPTSTLLVKLLLEHGCDIGKRDITVWRKALGASDENVVVITETPCRAVLPFAGPSSEPGESGTKALGKPSVKIDLAESPPSLPDFSTPDSFESLNIRRLCSGAGTKLFFQAPNTAIVTGSVVEWKWCKLDGDLRPRGRGLLTVGELATTAGGQALLGCSVCFEFFTRPPRPEHLDTSRTLGNAFQPEIRKSEISWTMRKSHTGLDVHHPGTGIDVGSKPVFRSEDFRSTIDIGWIPENGVDFFTLFIVDLHKKWRVLFDEANSHLSRNREILLRNKGRTTEFIDNLLVDAQQWSNFRSLLQTHVRKARDLVQDFEENQLLCAEVRLRDGVKARKNRKNRKRTAAGVVIDKLSNVITRMELEAESEIKKLDEKTKGMIQLEFNLVSIYEARTSKTMGMSMRRLSWITFIFLPLMFVASLFGTNVDIINGGPDWWWVIVFSVVVFSLVILVWALLKVIRFEEWAENGHDTAFAERLKAYSRDLRRSWLETVRRKRSTDLESGEAEEAEDETFLYKPPDRQWSKRQWAKLKEL